jgi:hypothetical protein
MEFIHDDISLMHFVILGLTKPAPYLIRGNPSRLRRDFWIPAFAGMTRSVVINDAVLRKISHQLSAIGDRRSAIKNWLAMVYRLRRTQALLA